MKTNKSVGRPKAKKKELSQHILESPRYALLLSCIATGHDATFELLAHFEASIELNGHNAERQNKFSLYAKTYPALFKQLRKLERDNFITAVVVGGRKKKVYSVNYQRLVDAFLSLIADECDKKMNELEKYPISVQEEIKKTLPVYNVPKKLFDIIRRGTKLKSYMEVLIKEFHGIPEPLSLMDMFGQLCLQGQMVFGWGFRQDDKEFPQRKAVIVGNSELKALFKFSVLAYSLLYNPWAEQLVLRTDKVFWSELK